MATQKDIRFTIYDEFETVLDGLVSPDTITDEMPHKPEQYPAVVHSYETSELNWNRNMSGVTDTQRDTDGNATALESTTLHRATFDLTVAALSKSEESTIHTTLKNYFQKYTKDLYDESDIHTDIFNVEVGESTEVNAPDRQQKTYGHNFTLTIDFERFETKDVDAIEAIDQDTSVN